MFQDSGFLEIGPVHRLPTAFIVIAIRLPLTPSAKFKLPAVETRLVYLFAPFS